IEEDSGRGEASTGPSMTPLQRWDIAVFHLIYGTVRHPILDLVFATLSTSALGWLQAILGGALLANPKWRAIGGRHLVAATLCALAPLFKMYVDHDRPSTMAWVQEQESVYARSFPSGHTTVAFAIGVLWFVTLRRQGNQWAPLVLVWSVLCGVSRIYRGVHWPSDVIGAALLGTLIGLGVLYTFAGAASVPVSDSASAPPSSPADEANNPS
ncbi:MAG: hypothetical protein C4320_08570, partial [Armatimonadota bacterium]